MKKVFNKSIAIVLCYSIIMLSTSCEKEDAVLVNSEAENNLEEYRPEQPVDGKSSRSLYVFADPVYDFEKQEWELSIWMIFCAWPKGNCLPTVEVGGSGGIVSGEPVAVALIDDFLMNFEAFTVSEFFSNDEYKILFPEIDSYDGVVDGIIDGNVKLHRYYNQDDETYYFIALPSGIEMPSSIEPGQELVFLDEDSLSDEGADWKDDVLCVLSVKDLR